MKGTWQTTDGGGLGDAVAAIVVVLVIAAVAGPVLGAVAGAVAELVRVLLIAAAVILGLAAAGLVAFIAWRLHHGRPNRVTSMSFPAPLPQQPGESLTAPRQPAIERPAEVHLHFHGVSAEEAAAVIRRVKGRVED